MKKEKILITSALPYANGPLHFGHIAGAYLPGDCYARFQRLQGNDTFYVCGSDEYGVAITLSAEMAGRTPKEHVDLFHEVNRKLFKRLNFSFDHYSRTTWKGHQAPVHQFFNDLLENGYIEEKVTDQLFSEKDQRFLADRYVVGTCPGCGFDGARGDECPKCGASYEATDLKNPRSKVTGANLVLKPTKHWFLKLDLFKDRLTEWLESKQWKPNVVNFVKGYIKDLRPRAITRDSDWGIPVPLPNTEGKVLYVWFDAPIGYLSATMEWAELIGEPEKWKDYWCSEETKLVNFIGKDNIPFHAAIFPAMVMGQNKPYKLVDELPANEFYMLEGRQFSKSEGWYIDLEDFFTRYTAEQIRYTIAANAPESSDSEFTWKDFQSRCNSDLLGKYGNLVNRILVFCHKNVEGKVPAKNTLDADDQNFLKTLQSLTEQAQSCYSSFSLRRACQVIMELAQKGNVYFDAKQPWKLAKDPSQRAALETTLACCLECLKTLALISAPILPETADKVWEMLGFDKSLQELDWNEVASMEIPPGQKLAKPEILFQKIEDEQIELELEKLHALSKKSQSSETSLLDFGQFKQLDIRVGEIVAAEEIEKSRKLLMLQVNIGDETRTIVSGIRPHYQAYQLVGRKVVVVVNLKPAKLMGVESQGMLLCASNGDLLELLSVQSLPVGSKVS
jgi:methionyl-tRNA synthetase